jgi:hypothetical protein
MAVDTRVYRAARIWVHFHLGNFNSAVFASIQQRHFHEETLGKQLAVIAAVNPAPPHCIGYVGGMMWMSRTTTNQPSQRVLENWWRLSEEIARRAVERRKAVEIEKQATKEKV